MTKFGEILKKYDEMSWAISQDNFDFGNLEYIKNDSRLISKVDSTIRQHVISGWYYDTREMLHIVKVNISEGTNILVLCRDFLIENNDGTTTEMYQMIAAMKLSKPTLYRNFSTTIYRVVEAVEVHKDERGHKYGLFFYKVLVNTLNYKLMSDVEQYGNERNLWVSLSKDTNFKVDIVDLSKGMKVLYHNVTLKDALDERVWTDEKLMLSGSKEERRRGRFARLVLSKVG